MFKKKTPFGSDVERALDKLGMTKTALAKELKFSRARVSDCLREPPDYMKTKTALAKYFLERGINIKVR